MPDTDDVVTRLQRVNYRLQTCWTQRSRLDEEIVALQKKREFLISLAGEGGAAKLGAGAMPALAGQPTEQGEVSTSRFLPQVTAPQYQLPGRRITADDLLRRARSGVEDLQSATQEMAKATQTIGTTLDIVKNILSLITPEGRRQLTQIAQALFGTLSGAIAPAMARISTSSTDESQGGAPRPGGAAAAQSPDILSFLSYITSPGFFDLLSSFTKPRPEAENGGSAGN